MNEKETIIRVDVAATQDPSKKITLEYTLEFLNDLKAIIGIDAEAELKNILQDEADAEYEYQYGGKEQPERIAANEGN